MKNLPLFLLCLLCFLPACTSQDTTTDEETVAVRMRINFYQSLCNGAFFERKCLNFQLDDAIGGARWQKEAIQIEGFDFEHGYIYDLEIEMTPLDIENCQDDCPTHRYRLVRELSKTNVIQNCRIPLTENQVCTQEYAPVCGCDDSTYSNSCVAASSGIATWTLGECS